MKSSERKLTLLLLCWLFGLFGAHRLYTGKYVTGILIPLLPVAYLAVWCLLIYYDIFLPKPLTTVMIFSAPIWVSVDLARIIAGKFTDREGKLVLQWL